MNNIRETTFWGITWRTIIAHTVTYFIAGLLAFSIFNYTEKFDDPTLSGYMRPTDDPIIAAGVLFQPIRGFLFGIVFWLLRDILFIKRNGWLTAWIMLVIVGIFSTFGPTPGSVEGLIYTKLPVATQLGGLIEILVQSLLLSLLTVYWVKHSKIKWLNWSLIIIFVITLLLPVMGIIAANAGLTTG